MSKFELVEGIHAVRDDCLSRACAMSALISNEYFQNAEPDIDAIRTEYGSILSYIGIMTDYLFRAKQELDRIEAIAEREAFA